MTATLAAAGSREIFRRILRNAGLILGGKAATGLLNLAATSIAIHSLGLEAMGVLVLVHAFARTASSFVKFQSWQAVLRYGAGCLEPERRAEFHALLRFTAGLDLVASAAGCLVCAAFAWALGPAVFGWTPEVAAMAALYATSTFFMVTATPIGLLRLFDRFDLLARRDALGATARLVGAALAAAFGGGLPAFLAAWYAAVALDGLALIAGAWSELRRRGLLKAQGNATGRQPRRLRATEAHPGIWGFVWSTNLMTTLSLASTHVATLCVGFVLGPASAALFAIARQIGEAALKPSRFLTPALYPELARLAAAGDQAGLRTVLRRSFGWSVAAALVLLAALAVLGGPLLRLVGGEAATPAWGVMLLLAVAASISFAGFSLEPLLVSVERHGRALRVRFAAALAYIPVALAGLRFLGLEGVGVAAIVSALLLLAGQVWAARHWLRANHSVALPPR
ncbi:MAG TPA: lipopolysaccharide biosynthesis protein [Acetobacteraceae bacterium]|nr:lipopolysaccharide biosynthesis protein [Acetobacteraceae bacterium]